MLQQIQLHHTFPHLAQAPQVSVWVWFLQYHTVCPNSSGTGMFMPATSLLHLPPRGGSGEEAEKLLGLHFTTACIIQVAAYIPWLGLSGPVRWEAGGSVYTAR